VPAEIQFTTVGDTFSSAHATATYRDREDGWHKVTLPLYHYGEYRENTNYTKLATGEPLGNRPMHLRIDIRHSPWTREVWLDDFDLQIVDDSVAKQMIEQGPGEGIPAEEVTEYDDPYFVTTSFAPVAPFHILETDDTLILPLTILPNGTNPLPVNAPLVLNITDFKGYSVYTEAVVVQLNASGLSTNYDAIGFSNSNGLPTGLYNYEWSSPQLSHTASDRFWVRGTNRWLRNLSADEGYIGFDRWDLAYSLARTSTTPRRVLGEYDLEHLQLFADIGGRTIRLWLNGRSINEIDYIEDIADTLVPNGYEIVLCISGFSDENTGWSLTADNFSQKWNAEIWQSYIANIATRLHGKVQHYQVGNEIYDMPANNYMQLLTNTAMVIHAVDSNAVIHAFDQILAYGTLNLIDSIYDLGAAQWIDIADYHDYFRLSYQESYLTRLMEIVREHEDDKTTYTEQGEYWLAPTNSSIWQTEYFAGWSKITPGNRITEQECISSARQLSKMIIAKAFGVKRYILYNTRPGFFDNGMFAKPLHAPYTSPAISLLYTATATLAEQLTTRELKTIYQPDNAYVFGFGPTGSNTIDRIAAWSTAQQTPAIMATGVPEFNVHQMDGSSLVTNVLSLTEKPVFLSPLSTNAYDWALLFGTNTLEVRPL